MTIIGVTGYAQHGKDTVGNHLRDQYGFEKAAFAGTLRSLARSVNPIIYHDFETDVVEVRYAELVDAVGYEEAKKNPEVRDFLVRLGIGVREHIGPDAWVNALEQRIWNANGGSLHMGKDWVITDVRFPNEADWVQRNGTLIRVVRVPDVEAVPHDSPAERYVDKLPVDFKVTADTEENLRALVDRVLGGLVSTGALALQHVGSTPTPSTDAWPGH